MIEMKIKQKLFTAFNMLFILVFGYIFLDTALNPSTIFKAMNPLIVLVLFILLSMVIYGINEWFNRLNSKSLILISIGSFVIILLLQLLFIRYFKVSPTWDFGSIPTWDFGKLYITALESIDSLMVLDPYYYDCYPNNIPIFMLMVMLFRGFDYLGFTSFLTPLSLVNMMVILLSLGCMYVFVYRRTNLKTATLLIFFSIAVTPLYTYTTIVYTDTLSMLFPILGLLLYDVFYHTKSKKKYMILILLGCVLAVGTLIKTNVIILAVGISIHYFMTQKTTKALVLILILGSSGFVINNTYNQIIAPYIPIEMNETGYPVTHWIMMGLKGNGSYNGDDDNFTRYARDQQLLKNDIMEMHLDVIKTRLNEFGPIGFVKHLKNKVNFTWADGTYYAPDKLKREPLEQFPIQEYVYGDQNQYYMYLSQAVQLVILYLILLSGIRLFKENKFESVMTITLFGVFLFLLIWETRSRYLVLFIPLMLALASSGFGELYTQISNLLNLKFRK